MLPTILVPPYRSSQPGVMAQNTNVYVIDSEVRKNALVPVIKHPLLQCILGQFEEAWVGSQRVRQ